MSEDRITIDDKLGQYEKIITNLKKKAEESDRASGGYERSQKGKLVESSVRDLIIMAWKEVGGNMQGLNLGRFKRVFTQYI